MLRALVILGAAALAVLFADRGEAVRAPADRPAGTLVLTFGTNRLMSIDVATGRRTVRRVTSMAACGPQTFVTGGHVIFAGRRNARTIVFSAPVALDEPPTRLGAAHAFVPSATEGRVWLAGTDCDRRSMTGVREVTVDGRVTRESDRRVPSFWVLAAAPGGIVVERSRQVFAWDPDTGRAGRPLGLLAVTATHGSLLAGCAAESDCSRLVIQDTATGRRVEPRPALEPDGRFSPDGSLLAVPKRSGRRWRVALVDTRDGTTTMIPGLRVRRYPQLGWAASTGWLLAQTGARRMVAYRPGMPRPVALPFRLPPRVASFVAG